MLIVGTPLYRDKYENQLSETGSVVAAEVKLISQRLMGTEEECQSVVPLLLAGDEKRSLPPLVYDSNHADFRKGNDYFATAFDLILSLYEIDFRDQAVDDLRESLKV